MTSSFDIFLKSEIFFYIKSDGQILFRHLRVNGRNFVKIGNF